MTTTDAVYSVAIAAQATLNMHSLNNEGGEGNQIQTRMVNIIGADGQLHNVNAISGDMFKHIQTEHLHRLSVTADLPLSTGALTMNANRINIDEEFLEGIVTRSNAEAVDQLIQRCAITDMAGTLVTKDGAGKNRSLPRKSVVEFGWVVGIPGNVETDSYYHIKFESERGDNSAAVDESGTISGKQTPFHRPASSGVYAIVLNLEIARIGFNDISQRYAIDDTQRTARMKVLLESVLHSFIEPAGAMRSTQNPHIVDVQGVVAISRDVVPAPCISPLKPSFVTEIDKVAASLNRMRPNAIEVKPFASLGELAEIMAILAQSATPFTLPVATRR